LDSDPVRVPSVENTNYTVVKHEDGYAQATEECATCEGECRLRLRVRRTVTGVSSDKIREAAQTISQHLKREYQSQYRREISQTYFSANFGWSWLGISAKGEYSDSKELIDKYENGEQSLTEARSQFARSISNYLNIESRIDAEAWISSSSPIPSRVCFYFRIQNIKLSSEQDQVTIRVISNDPDETKTGATGQNGQNAREIENEGIKLKVTTL